MRTRLRTCSSRVLDHTRRRCERLPANRRAFASSAILTPDRLAPLYRHAIAHIAPSVCFETFGNTLVESFRQRTPVIARNIGPFPEIVTHAGGGVLFDDADGLRSALTRFASDRGLRDQLGAAGRSAYEVTWSEEAIVPRYLDIVDRTIARRRTPARLAAPAVAVT